jgi:uncharacterized protein (TIGR01777 family)
MRIFVTGGMGFVGRNLTRVLAANGHQISILDRSPHEDRSLPAGAVRIQGDATQRGAWQDRLAEHDVVINLVGASIFRRWTASAKRAIRESRVLSTRNVVAALGRPNAKVTQLYSTSAVGYYGAHGDEVLEEDQPGGSDFLAQVAVDWEAEALRAREAGARVVITRFGLVMGKQGGILGQLVPVYRWFLGLPLGSGNQWFSWVHEADLANTFLHLLANQDLEGPVNCCSPNPVRNRELTHTLAGLLHRPVWFPFVPGFMVRLVLGEFGSVVLEGQRVVPAKLLRSGFEFAFPTLKGALQDALS